MNKKMFTICAVFALIISCKNYAISKDSENLKENAKEKVDGFLEIKKEELTEGLKNLGSEVSVKVREEIMQADKSQGQVQEQVVQVVNNENQEVEELKKKIEGTNDKTTLKTYSSYEEELEKKLKDKKEDKEKLKNELKELEKALKDKKEKRKRALEAAQEQFQEYKQQVESATGQSEGQRAGNQGRVGAQAWSEASKLGLLDSSNSGGDNTSDMSNKVIESALQKINEELKEIEEEKSLKVKNKKKE
ncbi:hypothetical protein [Borreliella bavariensis]|uniref:hypothetical protein n=1 Tax=Borreliella bavariensis TaxID=664662 RepID=UPI001BFFE8E0|nr:hypothetical protein [Borreliella bavariensis]